MKRIKVTNYGPLLATPDTAQALDKLTERLKTLNYKLKLSELTPHYFDEAVKTPMSKLLYLGDAGRAVSLTAIPNEVQTMRPQQDLAVLWHAAVPLGFTPWQRHPFCSPLSHIFHFLGPWQFVHDRLIAEGRGDHAWLSAALAAQVDVGVYTGDRIVERFVQAQLHRIGYNPGILDGIVGGRTASAIKASGLTGLTLQEVSERLSRAPTGVPRVSEGEGRAHLLLRNVGAHIETFGHVQHVTTPQGAELLVKGSGRLVVDFAGEDLLDGETTA